MGYNLIDLGLPSGTLWMDRNIGAKSPTDCGLYFAWGEIQGYSGDDLDKAKQFNWRGYKHSNGNFKKLTKYCNNPYYGNDGYTDNLVTLQVTDDAAYQFTNGECYMPTKEQIQELIDNTIYEWATIDSVNGALFTSKTNGNSIFVPAAGFSAFSSVYVGEYCYLWSSSLYENYYGGAWDLHFGSKRVVCGVNSRTGGFSVRGVKS